jgi:hypothetical protein
MWLFTCLLFCLGFLITVTKLSLARSKLIKITIALAVALMPLPFFPLAIRTSTKQVFEILNDYGTLSTLCAILIGEAIALMFLIILLMKSYYGGEHRRLESIVRSFPAIAFVAGLGVLQILIFNMMTGYPFWIIAGAYSATVFFSMALGLFLVGWVLKNWVHRLEAVLVLVFFQLTLSMFLPMIVSGLEVPETHFHTDFLSVAVTCGSVVALGAAGYVLHRLYKTRGGRDTF